ncbi:flavodoxin family protein [Pseudodesulfovibrio cashew]|uniref:Flavodoxin family protein n=1 Tax=Pseudodesulfovibrio cashew TaxID=2678688 RepID=A0A6I6JDI7_9BACT|nr:flavodoxin family protein [Pseudodesulfovibrio cashew]QGY39219.1 flavodoxin family protein [Pseudodesulfovibrio cashew]
MKILAFNGSPRRGKWNTATMLENALEGARSAGAETELINLYKLDFKGCSSCFACKRKDRKETGVCVLRDDLQPVLEQVREADGLLLGTPVYYGAETSTMRAFMERLQFPYLNYENYAESHFPRKIPTGLIYTMNVNKELAESMGYPAVFERARNYLAMHFGSCELLEANYTTQYDDYAKYEANAPGEDKAAYRAAHFEDDCRKAYELGVRLASGIPADK